MITFKISGTKYQIPTSWGDVTYAQYIQLLKTPNNLIDYIHVFTGIDRDLLAKAELRGVEKMVTALSFLSVSPKLENSPSRMIGPYVMPRDVTLETLGQFEDLRALIQKLPKHDDLTFKKTHEYTIEDRITEANLYLEACAIYVQKIINGDYDPEQVENVKHRLMTFSCIQILQTGTFFFSSVLNMLMGTTNRSQRIIPRLKKLLQDFPGYQKSLDFLLRSSKQPSK
jgi:hypothetical protein